MAVQVKLRQAGDVDAESLPGGQPLDQSRVEPVDAFQHDDLVRMEPHRLARLALARQEIIVRELHFLPGDQPAQVLRETPAVQGVHRLEIGVALLVQGRLVPVDEVIVHLQRERGEPARQELDRQALREGGLAGGRRPGDQDHPRLVLLVGDLGRDGGDLPLVQRFRNQDHLAHAVVLDGLVQRPHAGDVQPGEPVAVLPESDQQLGVIRHRQELGGRVAAREAQGEALPGERQGEPAQVARGGGHIAVVVVGVPLHPVDGQVVFAAVSQQARLVLQPLFFKQPDRLLQRDLLAPEGQVGLHQLPHFLLQPLQLLLREWLASGYLAEIAPRSHRVVHSQGRARVELLESHLQQEGERAPVDAHPVRGAHGKRGDPGVELDAVAQLAQLPVHDRAHDGRRAAVFQGLQEISHRLAARSAEHPPVGQVHLHRRAGGGEFDLRFDLCEFHSCSQ